MLPDISLIKKRRTALNIKQKELAELSKTSQSLIAKIESNRIEPSYAIVGKIFAALENIEHKTEKKCSDVMSKTLYFVKKNDKVERVIELMKKHDISQIPVFDNRNNVGSFSESLILDKILSGIERKEIENMKVEEIMDEPFPVVRSTTPLSNVLPLLKSSGAILVSDKEKVKGIITKSNLI